MVGYGRKHMQGNRGESGRVRGRSNMHFCPAQFYNITLRGDKGQCMNWVRSLPACRRDDGVLSEVDGLGGNWLRNENCRNPHICVAVAVVWGCLLCVVGT